MPTVKFLGHVIPSAIQVSVSPIPEASWEEPSVGLKMKFRVVIEQSVVTVDCDINDYKDEYISILHMRALDLSRATVDLMAFATGYAVSVFFDSFTKPDGSTQPLWFHDVRLAPLCTAVKIHPTTLDERKALEAMIVTVLSEPALFMALNDLIQANTVPHYAPVNCGRAIDGLRNILTPSIADRDKSWPVLRSTINADKAYLDFVMTNSTGPRHGDRSHMPGTLVGEILQRTWIVMNRFLEFRKRGNKPLPLADFPMLIG
jgi:hypothetical protein